MEDRICSVCERTVTDEDIESSGQKDTPVEQETCPFCGHLILAEGEEAEPKVTKPIRDRSRSRSRSEAGAEEKE